ncbi:XTP/dITP diphosphatase [Aerococcus sp. 1KP-2016]|jgi:XTP/dITP diphosphohydrolase|uniref:XTP/dITP diphosphatase n=1 Tax=Aerococcus sp. 1KP-2016 TaxID=1981982 RepID=UPI000B99B5CC|nr:XTP/dITP diphosphatase [Aerococcus sp. 1KP-2016]OYQ65249.1 non-canonical purine NTP pyrophosphatase [Aerococcus sp. 1KP-2016]
MKEIMIATANPGKAKEFKSLFAKYNIDVKTLLDFPNYPEIPETGETFIENATIKATTAAKDLHIPVIADDSGLSVDALDGAPGVYSARYAGPEKSDANNRKKLLDALSDVTDEQRTARFHTYLVVADAEGHVLKSYHGTLDGFITREERGENGFGYDAIFYVPSKDKTTAQMSAEQKDSLSHRGNALRLLAKDLENGELILHEDINH